MEPLPVHSAEEWPYVLTLLPEDLEESARETEALVRCRNVPDAAALLRMALAYAVSDPSLKDVAAWASALEVASITGPGLFYRLREAERWLERVLAQTLEQGVANRPAGLRLRIVDATVINGPGALGTQWRAHLLVSPMTGRFQAVQLTDATGGEGYARHPIEAGDVVLGDRAYATARGLHAVRSRGAHVVARLNPHTLRMCDARHRRISLIPKARQVPKVGAMDFDIIIPVPPEKRSKSHKPWRLDQAVAWQPARVTAGRTRKGEVIWVLSTLAPEDFPPLFILNLYRLRWQVELLLKRLKSLLHLDALPSRQGPTAKSWMLARLLAAALAQHLVEPSGALSPWGYELRETRLHP
jgi:hypothetical protein